MFRLDKETIKIPADNVGAQVAVVMIARNEEKNIANSLESIVNQELKPYRIIVVNDGSSDKTGEIASSFENIEVVNREKHESLLAKKELANTNNTGFFKLHNDRNCQYVLITGADLIFPKNYLSTIATRMQSNSNIAVASGVISGEHYREPQGPGRVVNVKFWREIGFCYPVNYAFEAYLLWKAQSLGYVLAVYPDLVIDTQRRTGTRFNPQLYYYYGLGEKALGYIGPYFLYRLIFFSRKKNPKGMFYYLKGYLSKYNDLYEPELRDYVRKRQWYKLRNVSKQDFNFILSYIGLKNL